MFVLFVPQELSQQRKENPSPTELPTSSDIHSVPYVPPSKKRRYANFTPHDYNYTSFADVTASHDPPAVPYTPYSTEQVNKKQHKVIGYHQQYISHSQIFLKLFSLEDLLIKMVNF